MALTLNPMSSMTMEHAKCFPSRKCWRWPPKRGHSIMVKPDTYIVLDGVHFDVFIDSYEYFPEGVRFIDPDGIEVVNIDPEYDDLVLLLSSELKEKSLSRLA